VVDTGGRQLGSNLDEGVEGGNIDTAVRVHWGDEGRNDPGEELCGSLRTSV